jgi:hypothetical protein
MMVYFARIGYFSSLFFCFLCISAIGGEASWTKIELDGKVGDWAMQESTGRLFASLPDANAVVEIDLSTGKEKRRIEIPGGPRHLIFKRDLLIVGCTSPVSLVTVDLKNNKAGAAISLPGKKLTAIFCSQVDNSRAYAVCETGGNFPDLPAIAPIDLSNRKVLKSVPLQGVIMSREISHVKMSPDGCWIAWDAGHMVSPSGGNLASVEEETATFQERMHLHESFGPLNVDAASRWWTLGNLLYSISFEKQARAFKGRTVAIHPLLDLAASMDDANLYLETLSESVASQEFALPFGKGNENSPQNSSKANKKPNRMAPPRNPHAEMQVFFDLTGNRTVCISGEQAAVFDFSDKQKGYKPRMQLIVGEEFRVSIDKKVEVSLETNDKKRYSEVKYSLVSAPKFVSLVRNHLVISPKGADIGEYDFSLKATCKDANDERKIHLTTIPPCVELDCVPTEMVPSVDGQFLLAWGSQEQSNMRRGPRRDPGDGDSNLSLIDLTKLKVVNSENLSSVIRTAALDEKYIYYALQSGNAVYRANRADWSKKDRIFVNSLPQRIVLAPDKNFAIILAENHGESVQMYDRETLQKNESHYAHTEMNRMSMMERTCLWEPRGDGVFQYGSIFFDAASGKRLCYGGSLPLPPMANASFVGKSDMPPMMRNERIVERWSRVVAGNQLLRDNTVIGHFSEMGGNATISTISADYPLLIAYQTRQGEKNEMESVLEYRELKTGDLIHEYKLSEANSRTNPRHQSMMTSGAKIAVVRDKVVLFQANKVLVITIPKAVLEKVTPPLLLKYPQLLPVTTEKPLKLKLASIGGEGAVKYSLLSAYDGLSLDSKTGAVELDIPALWKKYLEKAKPSQEMMMQTGSPAPLMFPAEAVLKENAAHYQNLTGEELPADKRAFTLPLNVKVSDTSGQIDSLMLSVIVLVSAKELDEVIKNQKVESERNQEKAKLKQAEMQQEILRKSQQLAVPPKSDSSAGGSEGDRIQQLENRVRRLEAALDQVLQKLDKVEKSAKEEEKNNSKSENGKKSS